MSKKWISFLTCVAVGLIIWFIPVPAGLKPQAWHLFAIFVATILGFILQPFPMGSMAIMAIVIAVFTRTLTIAQGLTGFANTTVWLIVSAFLFAAGFIKTGLGRRIAYVIMRRFGDNSLKLAYSLAAANLVLGPVIPSNSARAGGVLFPIVKSLCSVFGSEPGPSSRKIGAFLTVVVFQTDLVICAMFLTSMAANPLMAELAQKTIGVTITWNGWFIAAIVPGLISLICTVYAVYRLVTPEVKRTPEATQLADNELAKMGPMSIKEKYMTAVFITALLGWIFGSTLKLDGTAVALLGVALMLLTDVLEWKDVVNNHAAWDILCWTGTILMMAGFLNTFGLIGWFAKLVGAALVGVPWIIATLAAGVVYMYSHYGFASMSAHVTAMYAALIAVAAATGAPVFLAAFIVAIAANLCGCLTNFSTGPAPIYFGAGYTTQAEWWKVGFLMSVMNMTIWYGVGMVWWKVLGLW